MPDKLEEIMKKLHIYLANCKESAYSSEDIIVSRKRILGLLDELNKVIFDLSETYEATKASRERALLKVERQANDIRTDAESRADDVYAASLVFAQDAIEQTKNSIEYTYLKVRREYDSLLQNYEEKIKSLNENAEDIRSQLADMKEGATYLKLIEQQHENANKSKLAAAEAKEKRQKEIRSQMVGTVVASEVLAASEGEEKDPVDTSVSIKVHNAPQMAEISTKQSKKQKEKKKKETIFDRFKKPSLQNEEAIEVNEEAISKDY